MERGVIYCAIGDKYIDQVIVSANGVKKHNPDLKVALFSDTVVNHPSIDINIDIFGGNDSKRLYDILKSTDRLPSMKVMICHRTPFKKTLSLDSDTYVRGDISYVFNSLDNYGMLFTHEPKCSYKTSDDGTWRETVDGFVDYKIPKYYNAGVFAYKNTPNVMKFIDIWRNVMKRRDDRFKHIYDKHDQNVLNYLIDSNQLRDVKWSSDVLDNKVYNAIDKMWVALQKEGSWEDVKILHSGFDNYFRELDDGERSYDNMVEHQYFDVFRKEE